jgi:hypothetical protein
MRNPICRVGRRRDAAQALNKVSFILPPKAAA